MRLVTWRSGTYQPCNSCWNKISGSQWSNRICSSLCWRHILRFILTSLDFTAILALAGSNRKSSPRIKANCFDFFPPPPKALFLDVFVISRTRREVREEDRSRGPEKQPPKPSAVPSLNQVSLILDDSRSAKAKSISKSKSPHYERQCSSVDLTI